MAQVANPQALGDFIDFMDANQNADTAGIDKYKAAYTATAFETLLAQLKKQNQFQSLQTIPSLALQSGLWSGDKKKLGQLKVDNWGIMKAQMQKMLQQVGGARQGGGGGGGGNTMNSGQSLFGDKSALSQYRTVVNAGKTTFPALPRPVPISLMELKTKKPADLEAIQNYNLGGANVRQIFPGWQLAQAKKAKESKSMSTYEDRLMTKIKDKDSEVYKKMGSEVVKWDTNENRWKFVNPGVDRKVNERRFLKIKNTLQAGPVLQAKLSSDQLQKEVPKLVQSIVSANQNFSKYGIGPVSYSSLPFYAGRWYDGITGRVRILPNASTKYVNPLSYQGKLDYLQARVINHWNSFVDAQHAYYKHAQTPKQSWQRKARDRVLNSLRNQPKYEPAYRGLLRAIQLYMSQLPTSQRTVIVLQKMTPDQVKQLRTIYAKALASGTQQSLTEVREKVEPLLSAAFKLYAKPNKDNSVEVNLYTNIQKAFSSWYNEGVPSLGAPLKTLYKCTLSNNMTQKDVESYEKNLALRQAQWQGNFSLDKPELESLKTAIADNKLTSEVMDTVATKKGRTWTDTFAVPRKIKDKEIKQRLMVTYGTDGPKLNYK